MRDEETSLEERAARYVVRTALYPPDKLAWSEMIIQPQDHF